MYIYVIKNSIVICLFVLKGLHIPFYQFKYKIEIKLDISFLSFGIHNILYILESPFHHLEYT